MPKTEIKKVLLSVKRTKNDEKKILISHFSQSKNVFLKNMKAAIEIIIYWMLPYYLWQKSSIII